MTTSTHLQDGKANPHFQLEKLWLHLFGILNEFFTSIYKIQNYQCWILLYDFKRESEVRDSFQENNCPAFSLLPSGQCSPLYCCFDYGNFTETQVGYPTSSYIWSRFTIIGISPLRFTYKFFRRKKIKLGEDFDAVQEWINKIPTLLELRNSLSAGTSVLPWWGTTKKFVHKSINNCNNTNCILFN